MLLRTDNKGRNAWYIAANGGKLHVMKKLGVWAKEILAAEKTINEILLLTDNKERNAWYIAANGGIQDVMQEICEWVKEIKNEKL